MLVFVQEGVERETGAEPGACDGGELEVPRADRAGEIRSEQRGSSEAESGERSRKADPFVEGGARQCDEQPRPREPIRDAPLAHIPQHGQPDVEEEGSRGAQAGRHHAIP